MLGNLMVLMLIYEDQRVRWELVDVDNQVHGSIRQKINFMPAMEISVTMGRTY